MQNVFHPEMETLEGKYFASHPDEPVVFHRKEILNARTPFMALKDPAVRKRFDLELLLLMRSWEYVVILVCLDKKNHKETYNT